MPVRKPTNFGGNIIGRFPSIKMGRMIHYESTLERDYLFLLDYDPTVLEFEEQPLTIDYEDQGKERHFTPDFLVIRTDLPALLIECKPFSRLFTEENVRKAEIAHQWCEEQGMEFRFMTEQDLRSGSLLRNIKMLWPYARHQVDIYQKQLILSVLHSSPRPLTVLELATQIAPSDPGCVVVDIYHLIFTRNLVASLEQEPVSIDSIIRCFK